MNKLLDLWNSMVKTNWYLIIKAVLQAINIYFLMQFLNCKFFLKFYFFFRLYDGGDNA